MECSCKLPRLGLIFLSDNCSTNPPNHYHMTSISYTGKQSIAHPRNIRLHIFLYWYQNNQRYHPKFPTQSNWLFGWLVCSYQQYLWNIEKERLITDQCDISISFKQALVYGLTKIWSECPLCLVDTILLIKSRKPTERNRFCYIHIVLRALQGHSKFVPWSPAHRWHPLFVPLSFRFRQYFRLYFSTSCPFDL